MLLFPNCLQYSLSYENAKELSCARSRAHNLEGYNAYQYY